MYRQILIQGISSSISPMRILDKVQVHLQITVLRDPFGVGWVCVGVEVYISATRVGNDAEDGDNAPVPVMGVSIVGRFGASDHGVGGGGTVPGGDLYSSE